MEYNLTYDESQLLVQVAKILLENTPSYPAIANSPMIRRITQVVSTGIFENLTNEELRYLVDIAMDNVNELWEDEAVFPKAWSPDAALATLTRIDKKLNPESYPPGLLQRVKNYIGNKSYYDELYKVSSLPDFLKVDESPLTNSFNRSRERKKRYGG